MRIRVILIVLLNLVIVPSWVEATPQRPARQREELNRTLVWNALSAAAAREGWRLPEELRPEGIEWSVPLEGVDAGTPLQVRGIAFDPLLQQLRFRLRAGSGSSAPWFSGWCRWRAELPVGRDATRQTPGSEHKSPAECPVSPRRLAVLQLQSANALATLQVRALESGEVGQRIRVRIPSNGHMLRAQVVGRDLLTAQF
jgi:hypothetical protein